MNSHANTTSPIADTGRAKRSPSTALVLIAIGLLYVSFGISFGLLEFSVPPILMSRGVNLAAMGWVIALYVPFGLTFLWAPVIDGKALPWFGYRIGWIVVSQCVSAVLLLIIAFGENLAAGWLFAAGLAVCFAVATMDLALDALAVDVVRPTHRISVAALKVAALAAGGVIGGGVLLGLFAKLEWTGIFLIAAVVPLVSTLPVIALVGVDQSRKVRRARPNLLVTLMRPGVVRRFVLLSLLTTVVVGLAYFQRPLLVEMRVPIGHIGWTLGTLSPLLNAASAALAVPAINRFRPGRVLWILVAICVVTNLLAVAAIGRHAVDQIMALSLVGAAAGSAISVILYTLILKWAEGDQAATDYSFLCGGSRMVVTLALLAVHPLLPHIGWKGFYWGASVLLVALTALASSEVKRLR